MNHLQFQTLCKMKEMIKECSHIDLLIRVGGEDKLLEADFLKEVILALPSLTPEVIRELNHVLINSGI